MKFLLLCPNARSPKVQYGAEQLWGELNSVSGSVTGSTFEDSLTFAEVSSGWRMIGYDESVSDTAAVKAHLDRLLFSEEGTLGREGYQLLTLQDNSAFKLALCADQDQGFLYGLLELAEQWGQLGTVALVSKTERAYVSFRGAKCNLPWEPYQEGYSTDLNDANDVYWDLDIWKAYLDRMAKARVNVLTLWSQHPYHLMVKVPGYPEACPFTDEQMEQKQRFWETLFAMAKARGMDVYMLTWNIHIHETFAQARGFQVHGQDHPVIRDYLREAIKELIRFYDDLTGFATNPGERMYNFKPGVFEEFITDVYFRALKEAKRQVPFIMRSNWLPAEATRATVEQANYPEQVYIDWKFNTSHGLSTWKLNGSERNRFLNPRPTGYKMLWHVRNEEAYMLQWGDPEFVGKHVVHNADPEIAEGYFFGPERVIPFLEEVRLDEQGNRVRTYDFDRRWYMYEAWGRMGYNPQTAPEYWYNRLKRHYELTSDGKQLYDAMRAASQVPQQFNTFWAGSWDGTAYAEGNLGMAPAIDAWEGTRERRFISVTDFIFHNCLDPDYLTVPEYVISVLGDEPSSETLSTLDIAIKGRITPFDVARMMEKSRTILRSYLDSEEGAFQAKDRPAELERAWLMDDLQVWMGMAVYYHYKIQASTYLYAFMYTGEESYRSKCCNLLQLAADEWGCVADFTRSRYARQGYDHFSVFHWERYVEDARKDIALALSVKPLQALSQEIRCFQLGAYASDGWGTAMDRVEMPEAELARLGGLTATTTSSEDRWNSYLAQTFCIGSTDYVWEPVKALSPSLDVLQSGDPVRSIQELSKRYDIRHDFQSAYGEDGTAYMAVVIRSEQSDAALYELRTRDYAMVWVNGKAVFETPKGLWYTQGRRGGRFAVQLEQGDNLILIKVSATLRPMPDKIITHREDPERWGFHLERGFSGYTFDRHHIFPHTLRGLNR